MEKGLTVIICTHNPVHKIFSRCLAAVTDANKRYKADEVIIVDNNSTTPIADLDYVQDFCKKNISVKIINETQQGLTPARIRGIKEASASILVFIDDDNFISTDFFEKGLMISRANPHIGSWSGQVKLIFEEEPAEWTRKYWGMLAHREFNQDRWSNIPHFEETMPCGAGLFIRKIAADHYTLLHETGKRNIQLDRSGSSLFSAGDNDLAACACDVGLGVGLFSELSLDHYIPQHRLSKQYLLKLTEGIATSAVIFRAFRKDFPATISFKKIAANTLRLLLKRGSDKDFYKATLNGEKLGRQYLKKMTHEFS